MQRNERIPHKTLRLKILTQNKQHPQIPVNLADNQITTAQK